MNKQPTRGENAAAKAAGAAEYAIWLEPDEEAALREALRVAQEAQTEEERRTGGGRRLLRDARKLHQLYGQLARLGFASEDIERCLAQLRTEGSSLNDALDWACLHLPDTALPPSFRLAAEVAEEDKKERERALLLRKIATQPAKAQPEGHFLESKKRAAAFARRAAGKASAADDKEGAAAAHAAIEALRVAASEWRKRHATALADESSGDEDEELADQMGVLDLDELGGERLESMLQQKDYGQRKAEAAADEAEEEGRLEMAGKKAREARRLGKHADQLEAALVRLTPKYKTRSLVVGEDAELEAKRLGRIAKEVAAREAAKGGAGDEEEEAFAFDFGGDAGGAFGGGSSGTKADGAAAAKNGGAASNGATPTEADVERVATEEAAAQQEEEAAAAEEARAEAEAEVERIAAEEKAAVEAAAAAAAATAAQAAAEAAAALAEAKAEAAREAAAAEEQRLAEESAAREAAAKAAREAERAEREAAEREAAERDAAEREAAEAALAASSGGTTVVAPAAAEREKEEDSGLEDWEEAEADWSEPAKVDSEDETPAVADTPKPAAAAAPAAGGKNKKKGAGGGGGKKKGGGGGGGGAGGGGHHTILVIITLAAVEFQFCTRAPALRALRAQAMIFLAGWSRSCSMCVLLL